MWNPYYYSHTDCMGIPLGWFEEEKFNLKMVLVSKIAFFSAKAQCTSTCLILSLF